MDERSPNEYERVLVVAPFPVGDLLMLTPALTALRGSLPKAAISVLTKGRSVDVLSENPSIDETLTYASSRWYSPRRFLLQRAIRGRRFDVALLFNKNKRLRRFIRACRIPTELKADPYAPEGDRHRALQNVDSMRRFGFESPAGDLVFRLRPGDAEAAEALLAQAGYAGGPLVGIHTGCRAAERGAGRGPQKAWSPERIAALARRLVDEAGASVFLTGSGAEQELAREVAERAARPLLDLSGRTSLYVLAALTRLASVYVSPDTGAMHVAASQGARLVALFGPTNPRFCGPFMREADRVIIRRGAVDDIEVDDVWDAIRKLHRERTDRDASPAPADAPAPCP